MDIAFLTAARKQFEESFGLRADDIEREVHRLSDMDLFLTRHAFVARRGKRVLQITIEDEVVPTAFLKGLGLSDELVLLQILLSRHDLKIDACRRLYEEWIVRQSQQEKVEKFASSFG